MNSPINGPVDTSVRLLCALDAAGPDGADEGRLRFLDLFVVFSADVGGPENVHPSVRGRLNAWNFRMGHVLRALELLGRAGVAAKGADGRWRRTHDAGRPFADAVPVRYVERLSAAASWLTDCFVAEGERVVEERMLAAIEASGYPSYPGGDDRFAMLAESYRSDVRRLRGIAATAAWLAVAPGADAALASEMAGTAADAETELRSTSSKLRGLTQFVEECMPEPTDPVAVFRLASGLARPASEDIVERLRVRHSEEGRHYHGWNHVLAMLGDLADTFPDEWRDRRDLLLAILFHDAVYDPRAADNEERSADLADAWLAALPADRLARVRSLVMATDHRLVPEGGEGELIADVDLAILAVPSERYDRYAANVRREYAHVAEPDWRVGRAAVLRSFLGRDRIFRTGAFAAREAAARANIGRELADLEVAG